MRGPVWPRIAPRFSVPSIERGEWKARHLYCTAVIGGG